jgi:hypothetical protein
MTCGRIINSILLNHYLLKISYYDYYIRKNEKKNCRAPSAHDEPTSLKPLSSLQPLCWDMIIQALLLLTLSSVTILSNQGNARADWRILSSILITYVSWRSFHSRASIRLVPVHIGEISMNQVRSR